MNLERIREAVDGKRGPDQQKIAMAGLQLVDQLLAKNHDYGSSAWTPPILIPGISPP